MNEIQQKTYSIISSLFEIEKEFPVNQFKEKQLVVNVEISKGFEPGEKYYPKNEEQDYWIKVPKDGKAILDVTILEDGILDVLSIFPYVLWKESWEKIINHLEIEKIYFLTPEKIK
jgi:hypothetical protein